MLKHDHEHVPYFPAKNCTDPCQHVIEPIFEPHLLHGSKTELDETQRTHPALSDFLQLLYGRILQSTRPISSTGHLLENHCKGPEH